MNILGDSISDPPATYAVGRHRRVAGRRSISRTSVIRTAPEETRWLTTCRPDLRRGFADETHVYELPRFGRVPDLNRPIHRICSRRSSGRRQG